MENINNNKLSFASFDSSITSNEFRLLFCIRGASDNLILSELQSKLNFKTYNLLSKSLKKLIELNYITRVRNKNFTSFKTAKFSYSVNTEKPLQHKNINMKLSNDYFKQINYIYDYFFLKFPTKNKIDVSKNKKVIDLLLNKDFYSIDIIKNIIDFISINNNFSFITRPLLLRSSFPDLLKAYENEK